MSIWGLLLFTVLDIGTIYYRGFWIAFDYYSLYLYWFWYIQGLVFLLVGLGILGREPWARRIYLIGLPVVWMVDLFGLLIYVLGYAVKLPGHILSYLSFHHLIFIGSGMILMMVCFFSLLHSRIATCFNDSVISKEAEYLPNL
jgi:hypothetical protein